LFGTEELNKKALALGARLAKSAQTPDAATPREMSAADM
jgi:hypothetical protein